MFYITGLYRQWSDGQGVVTPPVTTPDVGHVSRRRGEYRRRYILDDGRHVFLTDDELRAYLLARLERKQKPAKRAKVERPAPRAEAKAPAGPAASAGLLSEGMQPTYPAVPRFDELWAQSWVQRQPEVMAVLRELAQRLELAADDEDVEILLLS